MATDPDFDKPRKHYVMRTEEKFTRDNPKTEDPAKANDVWQWRQDQRKIEEQAGTNELGSLKDYLQKRRRDFWTVFLINNGFFAGMMYFYPRNPAVLLFGLAGILIGTVGTYWILYHLMRKY